MRFIFIYSIGSLGRSSNSFRFAKRFCSSKDLTVRPEYLSKLRECYRLEETQQLVVPQFKRALLYGNNIAVKDHAGEYTYFHLYMQSKKLSRQISNICGSCSCSTIGLFYSNDVLSILCLWACWMAGQLVMPLIPDSPQCQEKELLELLQSAQVKMIINCKKNLQQESSSLANSLNVSHIAIDHLFMRQQSKPFNFNREIFIADNTVFFEGLLQNNFYTNAKALTLYYRNDNANDSKKWKFVSLSYKDLDMQMKLFVQTWNIRPEDRILHVITTQRVNDLLEGSLFALNKGCCLHLLEAYEATIAWGLIVGINMPVKERVNVILTDAKVYDDLLVEYDKMFGKDSRMVEYIKDYCGNKIRLMLSCSEKLSTETYGRWLEITGHSLYECSSICSPDILKKKHMENAKDQEVNITNESLASGQLKFRIVDSSNKVLFECNGKSIRRMYTSSETVVGSLWISAPNSDTVKVDAENEEASFVSTGDVVMYQDGVFKFIGRCSQ